MVSSSSQKLKFACPSCGAKYEVPESMAGKRGPCAKCGAEVQAPAAIRKKKLATAEYVPVECRVCQTRFYGTPDQIGQELKCPDCGARNVLQPPPEVRPKKAPAALEGEQYELWDVGNQPLPSDLAAAQPKFIAVHCIHCHTLMHATVDQIGQELKCPDCGKSATVPPPPEAPRSPLLDDLMELEVDRKADPGERPPVILPPVRRMLYEEEEEQARERAKAKALKTGGPAAIDVHGRRVLPPNPLLTGVLPFLFTDGVWVRWLILSVGYMAGGYLILAAIESMAALGGLMARAAMWILVLGGMICLMCTAAVAGSLKSIVTESSYGSDRVETWNTNDVTEWFPDVMFLIMSVMVANLPGGIIARLATDDLIMQVIIVGFGFMVLFPIVLLSQLQTNSIFGVVSDKILSSFVRCPGSWLLFYFETLVLVAVCIVADFLLNTIMHPVFAIPIYVAGFFLYSRLLGRLGWRLSDAISERSD